MRGKWKFSLVAPALALVFIASPTDLHAAPGDVVSVIPAPPSPFGLTWDGSTLWCGTYSGTIYQLDPATGDILDQFPCPASMVSGLGWESSSGEQSYLWSSDRDTDKIYRIDPTNGIAVDSFPSPESWPGGLAWTDTILWHSNYYSPPTIYGLDPLNALPLFSYGAPNVRPMGIAWDGNYLWNADYIAGMIYRLEPSTGTVLDSFPAPDDSPHDLAWDGTYLWVVIGGGEQMIYQIEAYEAALVIILDPDATSIPPGGTLGFTATLINNTEETQHVWAITEVTLPNGNPYPGNPLLGPRPITIGALDTLDTHIEHDVPGNAPLGTYIYEALVGVPPDSLLAQDSFEFEVTVVP
ncbi:hypothetical protein AMJ39_07230 [candidate division TA06 bacterium DG_24]|uniref:DUF11 domain-containing protein n=2 Tax=Bacteria division TA06 TaxID=1156500 RepID=A0A0S8JCU1_UNCT6|nr:MAG: hypothetical protein AMJ39_07230 [candidate division TA06 bacterium DG_24]KPL06684.1 MAG: hypothetical protein AMJ71_09620 [candidate division TA06 bacterium SM1_40]